MELTPQDIAIQEQIAAILADIARQGYSTAQPLDVGEVEQRMKDYAAVHGIALGSDRLYMTAKQLLHATRQTKTRKGLAVPAQDLIDFPITRFSMDLYYDGECFIYSNGRSKFVVHPNYEIRISREQTDVVNFITATRIKDKKEFNGSRFTKIN